jgi:hypothetical protein
MVSDGGLAPRVPAGGPMTRVGPRSSVTAAVIGASLALATGCGAPGPGADSLDHGFAELMERLSEPGAYFDTDNLISNETSYLHAVDALEAGGIRGGAYLGVGPDQNFSYIAAIQPEIAFIVDIRRDNMLQHLMFKALFELTGSRIAYLCLLHGRPTPPVVASWRDSSAAALVAYVDTVAAEPDAARASLDRVAHTVEEFGIQLSDEDRATIRLFHGTFIDEGLDLRFRSHGREPRPHYPTFRRLLLETDRRGRQVSYLATEDRWRTVDDLQERDRVIPVIGDFAGDHALAAIADLLSAQGISVSAFYTSNVELYLMRDGTFPRFARNVTRLPTSDRSVLIRSFFGRNFGYVHPEAVAGYYSVQLLQAMGDFVRDVREGTYRSYLDLVMADVLSAP